MGKASTNKKVARAANTGGGRTHRGSKPWGWYGAMAMVALLGGLLVLTSRNERQIALNPLKSTKPRPPAPDKDFLGDHWHAAYGVYICEAFQPIIPDETDPLGIHSHADGVIHIHPFRAASAGRKATLGQFTKAVGWSLSEKTIKLPGGKRYDNGDKCGDKEGKVQVLLNGAERDGDPKDIRLRDRDHLVVAFAPEGADIPKEPPSVPKLDDLDDLGTVPQPTPPSVPLTPEVTAPPGSTPSGSTPPGAPSSTTPGSAPPGSAPPTSAPPGTTATTRP